MENRGKGMSVPLKGVLEAGVNSGWGFTYIEGKGRIRDYVRMRTVSKSTLKFLIKKAYPNCNIPDFSMMIGENGLGEKGRYDYANQTIIIPKKILPVTLHEIAHHIEFSLFGETGHNSRFFKIFNKLIHTGRMVGILKYRIAKKKRLISAIDLAMLKELKNDKSELVENWEMF
jgi:hypothetical protein